MAAEAVFLVLLFVLLATAGGLLLAALVQGEGRGETMDRADAERRARRDEKE